MSAEHEDPCPADRDEDAQEAAIREAFQAGASIDELMRVFHWSSVQIEAVLRRGHFPLLEDTP